MSIPLAAWEAGTAYVDLGTALFQFLALAALTRAVGGAMGELQVLTAPTGVGTSPSPAIDPGVVSDCGRAAGEGSPEEVAGGIVGRPGHLTPGAAADAPPQQ